jgi:hypothetical protein
LAAELSIIGRVLSGGLRVHLAGSRALPDGALSA